MAILRLSTLLSLQVESTLISSVFLAVAAYLFLSSVYQRTQITSLGGVRFQQARRKVLTEQFLAVCFHSLLIIFEEKVKESSRIGDLSSSLTFSLIHPSLHGFVSFDVPSVTVPKLLVANLLAMATATCVAFLLKYLSLAWTVLRYWSMAKKVNSPFQSPPKRVLIIHGSIGAGHKRAAQALSETFRDRHPELVVEVIDIIDYCGDFFGTFYKSGYLSLAEMSWGSHLIGYFFDAGNTKKPGWFKRLVQEAFLLDLISFIYHFSPDVIVNTHFLSVEIVAGLRRRGLLECPQVTVVTDYDAHAFWANYPNEMFFVGQQGAMGNLTYVNPSIKEENVMVTGIPSVPVFATLGSKKQSIKKLGLEGESGRPIVMITASGARFEGQPSVLTIYKQALSVPTPMEVIVVTGRQKDLRAELEKIEVPPQHSVKLEGFTTQMHEYMNAADLIVTKPGGLTTAESLAVGIGMIIVNPYPGQEMRNTDNLLEQGVAVKCNDLYLLGSKLESIVSDPARLEGMKRASKKYGNVNACFEIADFVANGDYGYIGMEEIKGRRREEREERRRKKQEGRDRKRSKSPAKRKAA